MEWLYLCDMGYLHWCGGWDKNVMAAADTFQPTKQPTRQYWNSLGFVLSFKLIFGCLGQINARLDQQQCL